MPPLPLRGHSPIIIQQGEKMSLNGIEITDVAIFPIKNKQPDSKLEAFAKITFNESFIVSGIRVVRGSKGLFLGFPQNYNKEEKKGYDICFPVTAELRDSITSSVLHKYKEVIGDSEPQMTEDDFMEGQQPVEGFAPQQSESAPEDIYN